MPKIITPNSAAANVWETGEYQAFVDAVQKPDPAAADLVERSRKAAEDNVSKTALQGYAIALCDRTEAQAREIARLQEDRSAGEAQLAFVASERDALKDRVARLEAELRRHYDWMATEFEAEPDSGHAVTADVRERFNSLCAALAEAPDA